MTSDTSETMPADTVAINHEDDELLFEPASAVVAGAAAAVAVVEARTCSGVKLA
eukprot:CAMPEP_0197608206 /NCGR_PEP_ID=MMETSP1326-20131121/48630_1 /TAXON_ID=1155430 /ORGANISM="Genus nov. species nov., Strain RCC2288" /LENGTH=53 /DNA_ID=CAMNT_0043176381 /DNA_START=205 /DNA_END=363 /DNA_ORIENTATION=+